MAILEAAVEVPHAVELNANDAGLLFQNHDSSDLGKRVHCLVQRNKRVHCLVQKNSYSPLHGSRIQHSVLENLCESPPQVHDAGAQKLLPLA